jgi:hypothetical protein
LEGADACAVGQELPVFVEDERHAHTPRGEATNTASS